jgi:glycosyltransferase involved in cell wall biosynthesis
MRAYPILVSAVMPTRGRSAMARRAVESWSQQTWPETELVIVDDVGCRSFPGGISGERILYVAAGSDLLLGSKRNLACSLARGEVIVHFDSDDYSLPGRMRDQVERLLTGRPAQVTGYHSLLFQDLTGVQLVEQGGLRSTSGWWLWKSLKGEAAGTSLCYFRSWWAKHQFANVASGEDDLFWQEAGASGVAISSEGSEFLCATHHRDGTSGRLIGGAEWEELLGNPLGDLAA